MRVLFDTDVILDVLLDRKPHADSSALLLSQAEKGVISGYLCATSVTTIHYLVAKTVGPKLARPHIEKLLSILDVAPVSRSVLEGALGSTFHDFEDGVTHEAAKLVRAQAIATRNLRDFRTSSIPVHTPSSLLSLLSSKGGRDE